MQIKGANRFPHTETLSAGSRKLCVAVSSRTKALQVCNVLGGSDQSWWLLSRPNVWAGIFRPKRPVNAHWAAEDLAMADPESAGR